MLPSPGGQISRMGACHPDDLPEGYHTAARGQSLARRRRLRRGLPTSVRAVGLRQVDGMALAGAGAAAGPRCDQICDQDAAGGARIECRTIETWPVGLRAGPGQRAPVRRR